MRLAEAFEGWLRSEPRRPGTVRGYRGSIGRLSRAGFDVVEEITRERVERAQADALAAGADPRYVRAEFIALRSVLSWLADRGAFPETRLKEIRKSALHVARVGRRRRVRFLTREELEQLASAAARVVPRLELPIRVAALAGPRVGELARMRAEDFRGRSFAVVSLPEFGEAGSCKTGERVVPVCAELDALVRERLPRAGWLFPSGGLGGRAPAIPFLSRCLLEDGLKRARRAAGLGEEITFTILRHTRASWWLQGGVSLYKCADWLGHDFATCEEFYGSLVDGYDVDCERMPLFSGVRQNCA